MIRYSLACQRKWKIYANICKPNTCVYLHWMHVFFIIAHKLKLHVLKCFLSSKFMIFFKLDSALLLFNIGQEVYGKIFCWNDQSLVWKNTKCISKVVGLMKFKLTNCPKILFSPLSSSASTLSNSSLPSLSLEETLP